jgi:hypothetical protein
MIRKIGSFCQLKASKTFVNMILRDNFHWEKVGAPTTASKTRLGRLNKRHTPRLEGHKLAFEAKNVYC